MGRRPKRDNAAAAASARQTATTVRRSRKKAAPEPPIAPEALTEPVATPYITGTTQGQEVARMVLETVAQMPYPGVGLRTIAGILRGETRANWLSYIARTENWGALFPNSLASVEAFLKDLVRTGYIEGKHFVRLTERGQRVLDGGEEPPTPRRSLAVVPRTLRPLLWKLLLLRARLVNERKAPGLLKDEVLLQLLEKRPTKPSELKRLRGVGAFIANELGKDILRVIREFQQQAANAAPSDDAEKL